MFAQSLALLIDITVGTATEVDALKRTGVQLLGRHDLLHVTLAITANNKRLAWHQFVDILTLQVEGRLQYRALAGKGYNFVVTIVERRTYAPWVAHAKHLATASQSTHHVTTIVVLHRLLQHVAHLHMIIYVAGDISALKSFFLGFYKQSLDLAVQSVAH